MYFNGQTLRHKKRNELVRMAPCGGSTFAWYIGEKTALIREDGTEFADDIKNYTHVEDEFGRGCAGVIKEGQFVAEDLKKYLVSKGELMRMRKKSLLAWEARVLKEMAEGDGHTYRVHKGGKWSKKPLSQPGKEVLCPFADGGKCFLFRNFFLRRRKAAPLYRHWSGISKRFVDGPMAFVHTDGQMWMYNEHLSRLIVIEPESIYNGGKRMKKQKLLRVEMLLVVTDDFEDMDHEMDDALRSIENVVGVAAVRVTQEQDLDDEFDELPLYDGGDIWEELG